MTRRCLSPLPALSLLLAPAAFAYTPAPTAYTATVLNGMFGKPMTMTIYRDGDVAVFDHADTGTRGYNDLAKGRSYSWDTSAANPPCGVAQFSGDWGDPFGGDLAGELTKLEHKDVGAEVINGIRTRVVEAKNPKEPGTYRIWIDQIYGEVVKLVGPGADGKPVTLTEIKSLTLGKPPAAMFAMAPECAKAAAAAPPGRAKTPAQQDADLIAAATGRDPANYVRGSTGPGSTGTCSVILSVVQHGTLAPVTTPFKAAIDPKVDIDHPAAYEMGGTPLFKGGGLHDVTSQFHGGVARLNGIGPTFDVEFLWGNAGGGPFTFNGHAASAVLYKQCFGKRGAKLLMIVDAANLSTPADWLWEK